MDSYHLLLDTLRQITTLESEKEASKCNYALKRISEISKWYSIVLALAQNFAKRQGFKKSMRKVVLPRVIWVYDLFATKSQRRLYFYLVF